MTDIVERLAGYCTDYDGSPIPDGAEPMDGLHCDVLYASMNEILSLRSRAEKAEAERQQSSREWRKAFDAMHQRAMKAEATCEKLAAALSAAEEVANVAEQMTSSRSDDDWIWGVQAKIKDALSAYRNVTTVNASGPKGETPENCRDGGADAGN